MSLLPTGMLRHEAAALIEDRQRSIKPEAHVEHRSVASTR
jgi:hypothetical protein